jgi:hypothetical protein
MPVQNKGFVAWRHWQMPEKEFFNVKRTKRLLSRCDLYYFNTRHLTYLKQNKKIPPKIEDNVLKALSFYPELKHTTIDFILKTNIKTSVMQAQPVFRTLLQTRKQRRYRINISTNFKMVHMEMPIEELPDDVIIGWIGHELGHILDYETKTNREMVSFGYRYFLSPSYVKEAEIIADTLAVERGLGKYIVATKRFILDHAHLPQSYKDKIARLYLSPDIILEQVKKLEEKKQAEELR